jgi:hypothetical protein
MKSLSTGKGTKNSASQVQKANYICFLVRPCAIVGDTGAMYLPFLQDYEQGVVNEIMSLPTSVGRDMMDLSCYKSIRTG